MSLGSEIKRRRVQMNLSLVQFSVQCGFYPQSIRNIEAGVTSMSLAKFRHVVAVLAQHVATDDRQTFLTRLQWIALNTALDTVFGDSGAKDLENFLSRTYIQVDEEGEKAFGDGL